MGNDTLEHCALALVEYQGEWLDADGKLNKLMQDRTLFTDSVEQSERALEAARRAGMHIVHVGLRFSPGYPELGKARSGLRAAIPRAGTFRKGTPGSAFVEPFVPRTGEWVVEGRTGASGFAGSNLESMLRNNGVETIYLMGYASHVCVESTLRDAHDRGYDVVVLTDATAAFNRDQQRHFEEAVVHHFGRGIKTSTFVQWLQTVGH
ncbi:isochorismatase hydrolase [Solidesulfovibrio fructosivorans JJ]]|uniref:Isochorismatase hydrolase n=1 Tax=Solidesulfovibrio fructosivorans JJ] TaxID=596151 RepID=E1K0J6_SOLFR|nr:cysteine hydrolase [Solidesulfovibrio fructosivorans]EFL49848.1 isochorismatase hydrolase [Solidesulfovibrio fructosivorans JJ]]